jgi:hypothetical protein
VLFSELPWGGAPALAANACGQAGLAEQVHRRPLADARTYQPVNGTGGFSVFGARTLPAGAASIGGGFLGEFAVCQHHAGGLDLQTAWLPVAYGITDRLQVGIDIPYTWYDADKADFHGRGLDDINLGLLFRFADEAGARPAFGVLGFAAAPTGFRHQGIGRNAWDVGAKLVASKSLPGGLLAHANVGFTHAGDSGAGHQDDQVTSGLAFEYPLTQHVSLVAEGLADTNRRTGSDRNSDFVAETRAGLRLRYGPFLLSMAARKGLTNDAPDWGVFLLLTSEQQLLGAGAGAAPGAAAPAGPPAAAAAPAAAARAAAAPAAATPAAAALPPPPRAPPEPGPTPLRWSGALAAVRRRPCRPRSAGRSATSTSSSTATS